MATKTRGRKKAKKLRGGTNQPTDAPLVPTADDGPSDADLDAAEASLTPEQNADIDKVVDSVVPKPEANGHVGTVGEAVDQVIERIEEGKPAPDSPERLAEWDAETRRLLSDCAAEVDRCEKEYETKKEAAKAAKDALEFAWKDQHKTIKDREANRGKPVQGTIDFDRTGGHAAAQPDLREPSEVPPVEDESWKAVPLSELVSKDGLPQKVADLLAEADHKDRGRLAPIVTMGDLVKYQEPEGSGYTKRLTDLKGLGPKKEEQLSDATAKFWARWKPHANATEPANAGSGGAAGASDGDGQSGGDRPAGGDAAAQAEPEPASEQTADADPAGYHTEGSERVANRMRGNTGKRKRKK